MNEEFTPDETVIEGDENTIAQAEDSKEAISNAQEDSVPSPSDAGTEQTHEETADYSKIMEEDLRALKAEFSELASMKDICELKNPIRYGALRDLGLTAKEAYLASGGRRATSDNRAHLHSSVPKGATSPLGEIPRKEFEMAREIFSDLSDGEIQKLYRKVKG